MIRRLGIVFLCSLFLNACSSANEAALPDIQESAAEGYTSESYMEEGRKPEYFESLPKEAEAVSVYYGAVCYSLFSEDPGVIDEIRALFDGMRLDETSEGLLDAATTFQVYFTSSDSQLAAFELDGNGLLYLPDTKEYFRIPEGSAVHEELYAIYEEGQPFEPIAG